LVLLDQQPRYGNELMDLISERTGGQWLANPGAIYPLMDMLEKQELVEGKWDDPRKRTVRVYHLTPSGKQEMGRLKAIVRPKLAEAAKVLQRLTRDLNGGEEESPPPDSDDVIYL
jgi:PadR family transcriptional regulator PadR